MDKIDLAIINILQSNGRISNKKLSELIGLNPSTTLERVKKLEEKKIIEGYSVNLNMEKLGYETIVFIQVALIRHNKENIDKFLNHIKLIPQISEIYHIAGRYDYLLKIYIENNKELQHFLIEHITSLDCISKTETLLVFEEKKLDFEFLKQID